MYAKPCGRKRKSAGLNTRWFWGVEAALFSCVEEKETSAERGALRCGSVLLGRFRETIGKAEHHVGGHGIVTRFGEPLRINHSAHVAELLQDVVAGEAYCPGTRPRAAARFHAEVFNSAVAHVATAAEVEIEAERGVPDEVAVVHGVVIVAGALKDVEVGAQRDVGRKM